jgi:hypothetical protein
MKLTADQTERMEHFFRVAFERHAIYIRKSILKLPPPWTKSTVMQNSFFCNVFRRLDKTTAFIMDKVVVPSLALHVSMNELAERIVLVRHLSRIDTIQHLIDQGIFEEQVIDAQRVNAVMRDRYLLGLPIHTGAFMIYPAVTPKWKVPAYLLNTVREYFQSPGLGELCQKLNSLELVADALRNIRGTAGFMAYEYVTDFSYLHDLLGHASDIQTWCNMGPGSKRGMMRILNGNAYGKIENIHETFQEFTNLVLEEWKEYALNRTAYFVQTHFSEEHQQMVYENFEYNFMKLTMREVEHWLCEYDKYMRGGSSKRRYNYQ